ncbi:uncharacterized protein YndB with AHSA1/START domain [Herbihabitans rhizosphaerae]|uniref:Uncharacterized protein YndB with AHSA1/START domain n=1 Tax=Herbihabitans rhizosphaerae TaxID=1872711 RepID=A0A4Q7KGG4_9PSEU|nr:SRPBCC domain-containing protein [Herbihabitans rhizosphaerae]RZS31252.1 uncharacterized protein YndB with AHSA1/START domain [Herbihabitans rhizosphaerae]
MSDALLETIAGKPVLRFERRLAHPPAKVWRAITRPEELKHWFPAVLETEPRAGAPITFTFMEEDPPEVTEGEVVEVDEPKVFAYTWGEDMLRWELVPDGEGTLLVFTQTISESTGGVLAAGRNAAGWDECLRLFVARLDGATVEPTPREEVMAGIQSYIDKFGVGEPEVTEREVRVRRDLVWAPAEQVWQVLTGDGAAPGEPAPQFAIVDQLGAATVTTAERPTVLECDTATDGRIRWEITESTAGYVVTVTHTGAAADVADAWRRRVDELFAAVHGLKR